MQVIKRDGKIVDFDRSKIRTAIEKANKDYKLYRGARQKENFSRRYTRHY